MNNEQLKVTQDLESRYYRIEVLGKVSPDIWDHFEGEFEGTSKDKNGIISTSLLIRAQDQSELAGVINLLNNWRLVIVSVNRDGIISTNT